MRINSRLILYADRLKTRGATRTMFDDSIPHDNQYSDDAFSQFLHILCIL